MTGDITVTLSFLEFPAKHTARGGNTSPRIGLGALAPSAVSVALMATNPFIKTCCTFTTWIAWNIPAVQVIPEGIPSEGVVRIPVHAIQGTSDSGAIGYTGPDPPPGESHRYLFKVWVLDAMLDLPPGSDKHHLIAAMRGHVLQFGETAAISTG